jgi:hypothetical protein
VEAKAKEEYDDIYDVRDDISESADDDYQKKAKSDMKLQ